ncbi:hypothetical protein CLOM_g6836 [Closterium sp. NIES-68]|nr:hypothetical protein CLOM_g6836 [Closterium sp. NIES-68]GJP72371.1 hypothetical protein CLOP_g3110 [Closterium sp. NIES-67]
MAAAAPPVAEQATVSRAAEWPELSAVEGLSSNLRILSTGQIDLAGKLVSCGQAHLFSHWPEPGSNDDDKRRFFAQLARLDTSYPGGLPRYIANARQLLAESRDGVNPFEGFTPAVPSGERIKFGDPSFDELEARGVEEARNSAFVLVAGGLGERLGYSGIKVALPAESTTGRCFLQLYIDSILALQHASNQLKPDEPPRHIPLVIMTSDDTHARTEALLREHGHFGMRADQITLLKQEKVACVSDNDAHLALDPKDPYLVQTKPHGHGDVHMLLHHSGLLPMWRAAGVEWVLFFQDTNGLLFKVVPCSLGVSALRALDVNSLAVPRKAKEAIGGIARLTHTDGRSMVVNVEYNQLDPLLRACGHDDGDANDPHTAFSPFPGNINQLVLRLGPYIEELAKTHGVIGEFVNPKYADSTRTCFKASTRLECMMQDFPKAISPSRSVGFTEADVWLAYSPVKNNLRDAVAKVAAGTPPHSATSAELHLYRANCLILRHLGVHVAGPKAAVIAGQEVEIWPRVVWSPLWAPTLSALRSRFPHPESVRISEDSTLVVEVEGGSGVGWREGEEAEREAEERRTEGEAEGEEERGEREGEGQKGVGQVEVNGLQLEGALWVRAGRGARVVLDGLHVANRGWPIVEVDSEDAGIPEWVRIRGFEIERRECRRMEESQGEHVVRE